MSGIISLDRTLKRDMAKFPLEQMCSGDAIVK
jgi:hypothetical protein